MDISLLERLNLERQARRSCVLVTDIEAGEQRLALEADQRADSEALGPLIAEALRSGRSGMVELDGRRFLLTVHAPPAKLVVTGAVHISQAMAPMARELGLAMTVIDPRSAFATPERFPGIDLRAQWPDEALSDLALDRYTAFVALTHDPKIDDPALAAALRSECFYVGALGSRKTHGARLQRLREAGFSDADGRRIHAPIGLNIGAVSPAEIALAILAEIVASLRAERVAAKAASS